MVKPTAAQPRRRASETEPVSAWSFSVARLLDELTFKMVGIAPAKVSAPASSIAKRGRIGGKPGIDGELEMVMRVIGGRVRRERPGRAMFKALIHRKDDEFAGAAEFTLHKNAREVAFGAGIVAFIVREDFFNPLSNPHFHLQMVLRSV